MGSLASKISGVSAAPRDTHRLSTFPQLSTNAEIDGLARFRG